METINLKNAISRSRLILMIDSGAALSAGLILLLIPVPFVSWYSLANELFTFTGAINLIYGLYSGALLATIVFKRPLKKFFVNLLIGANFFWAFMCIGIIVWNWHSINLFGIAHIALEACFVVFLATLEFYFVRPVAV
ncbi:hypothetical protein [Leptospira yasudae]|uniref:Uncharacterized protein n=1 Tax=Leptospira yasudae TaxID=2202201 RepID=A0A6N4QJH8_9LEPT|nr:hypothetical protein [Leptospira yasudae]TGL75148.1 hypothetical protein EHQ72_16745 [Leptospira yasudae]TGL77876.1 hypothetical protein EHQ77_14860 [Leptospira yasudae]TGL81283.1 hypothetical protein EHQ83_15635 [Leptospira yasudae]